MTERTGAESSATTGSGPAREGSPLRVRLKALLLAPKDPAAVVVLRVALGLLVSVSAFRFLAYGWVDRLFVEPRFHFTYWGFSWIPHVSGPALRLLFASLLVLGLLVAVGMAYRFSVALLWAVFTYLQLYDVANYLNHYYLVSLLALLMFFVPGHRAFSVDVWLRPQRRRETLPAWCTYLLRFQVATVYVFAGLAKLNSDWLLHAQPLSIWLGSRTSLPLIGSILATSWAPYVAAWFGFLFDATVAGFLAWKRTRALAYAAVLIFHGATWVLFPIGMFPFIMSLAALVFFEPSWPRRFLSKRVAPAPALDVPDPQLRGWAVALVAVYGLIQIAVPLRSHLYGGNVSWHEQGIRFSWRVMTREKNGSVTFVVKNPRSGRTWEVPPSDYLTGLQEREMAVQPDLIWQLAQRIAADYAARAGGPVEVRAEAFASLNGRPLAPLIDPSVDLAAQRDTLAPKTWVLAAPQKPARQAWRDAQCGSGRSIVSTTSEERASTKRGGAGTHNAQRRARTHP
ncbi:MAG: HTTM domain-containing protein [Myxococcaceae bacterium]